MKESGDGEILIAVGMWFQMVPDLCSNDTGLYCKNPPSSAVSELEQIYMSLVCHQMAVMSHKTSGLQRVAGSTSCVH